MHEACHTCERGMSNLWKRPVTHMKASRQTYAAYHTHEWGMSHNVNEAWHIYHNVNEACDIYEGGISHVWSMHNTHTNEACHIYEWGMPHKWRGMSRVCMRHVTHVNAPCHISSERSGTGQDVGHVTHMSAACHKDTNAIWMWLITRMNATWHATSEQSGAREACHTYEWGMSHIWMRHVTHLNVRRVTHLIEACDTCARGIHVCDMPHSNGIHMCDMHSYGIHTCNTHLCQRHVARNTHLWQRHVARTCLGLSCCVSYRIHICDRGMCNTHLWQRHVARMNALSMHVTHMNAIWMRHVTHMNVAHASYECSTARIW